KGPTLLFAQRPPVAWRAYPAPDSTSSAGSTAASGARPEIRSAARSAIAIVGALVLPRGTVGITEASTTRRHSTPRTRSSVSTTPVLRLASRRDSPLIAQVPTG